MIFTFNIFVGNNFNTLSNVKTFLNSNIYKIKS